MKWEVSFVANLREEVCWQRIRAKALFKKEGLDGIL